jgi:predicted phosphodiesterase
VRIALISDLHANEVAFEAVLADTRQLGVDRVICLGDVATLGPHPSEVLQRLKDLGCPCILGNHDEFLLDADLIRRYTEAPVIVDAVDWCRAELSSAELDFVRGFVRTLEVPLESGTLFLFHGSPRSHMEDLLAETPPERVDEMLRGHHATITAVRRPFCRTPNTPSSSRRPRARRSRCAVCRSRAPPCARRSSTRRCRWRHRSWLSTRTCRGRRRRRKRCARRRRWV